jgi:fructose-1,6-bisphosphatase
VDSNDGAKRSQYRAEQQQKLDVLANQALLYCLGTRGNVAIMASEENECVILTTCSTEMWLEQGGLKP